LAATEAAESERAADVVGSAPGFSPSVHEDGRASRVAEYGSYGRETGRDAERDNSSAAVYDLPADTAGGAGFGGSAAADQGELFNRDAQGRDSGRNERSRVQPDAPGQADEGYGSRFDGQPWRDESRDETAIPVNHEREPASPLRAPDEPRTFESGYLSGVSGRQGYDPDRALASWQESSADTARNEADDARQLSSDDRPGTFDTVDRTPDASSVRDRFARVSSPSRTDAPYAPDVRRGADVDDRIYPDEEARTPEASSFARIPGYEDGGLSRQIFGPGARYAREGDPATSDREIVTDVRDLAPSAHGSFEPEPDRGDAEAGPVAGRPAPGRSIDSILTYLRMMHSLGVIEPQIARLVAAGMTRDAAEDAVIGNILKRQNIDAAQVDEVIARRRRASGNRG
jgi:hypothetical protein